MRQKFTRLPYILCYLCAFVSGMKQLREPDMWWQLSAGEWMLDNGAVTRTDMFSYTMEGTKWINVKWLYEVIIALFEKGLGPHGVMLLQSLVNVAMVYLLLRIADYFTRHLSKQLSTLYSVIAVILFLAVSESRMAGRPEMMSHLLTVVYLFVLWRAPKLEWKQIVWLIPLQCLWANMHEGYPVGMVLIGVYVAGSFIAYTINKQKEGLVATKRLAIMWVGMAVAILINPNTIQLWLQPFEIFRQLKVNKYTTELFSYTHPKYWTLQAQIHVAMMGVVVLYWIYKLTVKRSTIKWSPVLAGYLLSIPLFAYLSLSANRNIPFAQIVLFPTIPLIFLEVIELSKLKSKESYEKLAKRTVLVSSVLAIGFYVLVVSNKYYKLTESKNRYGLHVSMLNNPIGAAEFIKRHNIKGPAFSDYFVSSYLLWDLYPDFRSFIDLRDLDIFSEEFFQSYFDIYSAPQKFYELDSTYKFNYVVLSTSQLTSLQRVLYWKEGFNVVHVGPVSTVLLRQVEENDVLNSDLSLQLFTWPVSNSDPDWADFLTSVLNPAYSNEEEDYMYAPMHAGKFYNMVGNYNITKKQLQQPVMGGRLSDNAEAHAILAESYMNFADYVRDTTARARMLDSAMMLFKQAQELDPECEGAQLGLGNMAMMKGDYFTAKSHVENYLNTNHTNDFVYFLNGLCSRNIWGQTGNKSQLHEVIENMNRSLELNDNNTKAHLYLAEAYWHLGEKSKAREHMKYTSASDIPWMASEKKMLYEMRKLTGMKSYDSSEELIKSGAQ